MAETVTIEIPVSVKDNTSAGVQSAQKTLTAFEKSMQRTQQQLNRMDTAHTIDVDASDHATDRIGDICDAAENVDGLNPEVEVAVNDAASDALMDVQDRAASVDAESPDVDVGANDHATGVLSDVEDRAAEVDGATATVDVDANDMATDIILDASDVLNEFDSESGNAEIGVDDSATSVVRAAQDAVEEFSGSSGSAEIGANDTASSVIDNVTDKASEWGNSVWTGTIAIAGSGLALLGISTSVSDTLSTFESFESGMSQVEAISGASGEALDELTVKAKEMGATTKFTATEAAEAMTYMAMAGWDAEDMLGGIEGIMNLAAASGEDLATTSDIVTDALTAFGLSADDSDHFADVLATAASSANTTVSGMGDTFKYAGSMAGTLGYSIEDVALATGLMANSGVKGSMAGTALNSMFTRLSTNTNGAADALAELGIDFYDAEGNANDLSDILDELRIVTADWNDEQKTSLANTVAGMEAQKGFLAILNASEDDYNSLADAINNADGSAESMSETMLDNLEGTLTLMSSAIDGVKTSVGERLAPYVASVAEMITEAAPGAEEALLGIMDSVDSVAESVQNKITQMTNSDEWQEADLFGKVDIAWDTIIATPFTKWAGSKGKTMLSKGLSNLFTEALKILPGGEEAGITSWISAAVLGMGASTAVSGISSVVSALTPLASGISNVVTLASESTGIASFATGLTSIISPAALVTAGIAAAAAAIVAINAAIDTYNDKQISDSLETHFGNIELSATEAAEAAEAILQTDYMVNVELYLGEIENMEEFHEEAETALKENEILNWKSSVLGVTLSTDEQTEYTDNVSDFIEAKIGEIETAGYSAHIGVSTFLTGEAGEDLDEAISNYTLGDQLEMEALSEQLTAAVDNALTDGIVSVDEAQHIQELQEKMNAITSKWAAAENEAELQWIMDEYGNMTASQLTGGGFVELIEALQSQRATNNSEVHEAYTSFIEQLAAMDEAGRLGEDNGLLSYEEYVDLANQAKRNTQADELANTVLALENNTLNDTYGSKISENISSAESETAGQMEELEYYLESGNTSYLANMLNNGESVWNSGNGKNWAGYTTDSDQNSLYELYQTMKPDVTEMGEIIDQYTAAGQEVPQAVMDAYNEAIEIGAAAGDSDAAWQAYANELLETGSDELKSALTDESNPMYEEIRSELPTELQKAIDRAAAETTTDPVELDEVEAMLNGGEVEGLDEWLTSIQEQLDEAGDLGTVEETADGEVTFTVDKGDCLSQIGEILGVDWHEIAEANGLEDPYTIYPDMVLTIPTDNLEIETSGDEDAADTINEEMQEQLGNALAAFETDGYRAELSAEYDVALTLGEVAIDDGASWDSIAEAVGMTGEELAATNGMTIDTELTAGMTITIPKDQIDIDTSSFSDAVQEEMESDESTAETEMEADITVTDGEINTDEAVEDAQTAVDETFDYTYETDGSADITYTETNNADEVYTLASSELQSEFNSAIPIDASAVITMTYSISNPSATIQLSAGGTASATISASVASNATGGTVGLNGPELSLVGEEGLEYIIPTVASRRSRGISLWEEAGMALGVLDADGNINAYANGGAVGGTSSGVTWTTDGRKTSGDDTDDGSASVSMAQGAGNTIEVNVQMSPVIQIDGDGADEDKIFEVVKERIREVADDLGDEIAEQMSKIFSNMPVTQEAS
ncbi:MAG: phage tail tape measure protein [Lachnospiraceae bacterium]|nr:phage tail tape measure protein [Lachnospiraceae bacterium]